MIKTPPKLIELPLKGRAMIVTDIHGNAQDFYRYMDLWEEFQSEENHFILTGDFIHNTKNPDGSLEIIELVKKHYEQEENFHALLGNHEWAQLTGTSIFKAGYNQNYDFLNLVELKYGYLADDKLHSYFNLFRKLAIAVRTENQVLISHAGPAKTLKSPHEIKNIDKDDYKDNQVLYEMLWERNYSLSRNYLDPFLEKFGCKTSIVGHTPVDGVELNGNQLVVSSSFARGKKAYVELDLEKKINNGQELLKMVKYIDE
jgi:serine/threonine-protein phosphatase PP1 catalytic subunit